MAVRRAWAGRPGRGLGLGLAVLALMVSVGLLRLDAAGHAQAQSGIVISAADFVSIQAAIDSLASSGGAVYVPAGTHQVTAKVRVYSNVTVFGAGMDQTIIRFAPGIQVDHLMSNSSLSAGNTNIVIRDLTLAGNGETRSGCCFGLRLVNVRNSYVINVAADNHSLDGFYLGYNQSNGAVNNRLSGCRARSNGRNGIALTHGTGNAIDHCRVENNNTREQVAGIDLEPDNALTVSGNRIVGNMATGQNVGIQLYAFDRSLVTMSNNAVCTNTATGNVNAGIFDFNGNANVYVDNATNGNGNNFLVDPSALIGAQYANQCALGALPNPPPLPVATPTRTPTLISVPTATPVPPNCAPRPRIQVLTQPAASGRLTVTIIADRTAGAPNNTLRSLRFGAAQNAVIDIGSTIGSIGSMNVSFSAGTVQTAFVIGRVAAGAAATVPLVVVDDCGDWPTFVGGGPTAF
ncbi:MAG: glycosyl hydrolase family 28-related protein [Chloroflexota bacterium]